MPVNTTVLFGTPQHEIASMIVERLARSTASSIVTGFATPGGLDLISKPLKTRPESLSTFVVGAATYPAFEALDDLIAARVPADRLFVHLGHSQPSGTPKNPFVRFHPMLHSKVYFMELPDGKACALVGSNNVTSFALGGQNGEAAVLLEGPTNCAEFDAIRTHIAAARGQAVPYTPGMKESFAWWTREFIDGLRVEVGLPSDWTQVRTILIFSARADGHRPKIGDELYFEIPAGIQQIESLKTEAHLFLFDVLPADPSEALSSTLFANASYTCKTRGAESKGGNIEVRADWRLDNGARPILLPIPGKTFRTTTPPGMQQVRVEVDREGVDLFDYQFDRNKPEWDPVFDEVVGSLTVHRSNRPASVEARGGPQREGRWRLVKGLTPREKTPEADAVALSKVSPESGSFVLISLRRRLKNGKGKSDRSS
jgi:hypothetical protein